MSIAPYIDHTLLKPEATLSQIRRLCQEANEYQFASVCVNPYWVSDCQTFLAGTAMKICAVVGFPLGANSTALKIAEATQAVEDGASEIDMVINIGALKSGFPARVEDEITAVRQAVPKAVLKVIIETCLLSDSEKRTACLFAKKSGADFVKTSTGFSTGGATSADVSLMREAVGENMGVKASGGIKNLATARAMLAAGANRLGCSAGVAIISEERDEGIPF